MSSPNQEETSAEKFTRLANSRVNDVINALQKINLIGNLPSTLYEYTNNQIAKKLDGKLAEYIRNNGYT